MTNAVDPIFPRFVKLGDCSKHDAGLTKREYFAAMAMQGILARVSWHADMISNESVKQADALIAELAKNEVGQ